MSICYVNACINVYCIRRSTYMTWNPSLLNKVNAVITSVPTQHKCEYNNYL